MRNPTPEELEKLRLTTKGCNRALLAEWGIPWPPPSGWRKKLLSHRAKELTLSARMNGFLTMRDFIKLRREILDIYQDWLSWDTNGFMRESKNAIPWPDELAGISEEEIELLSR